MNSEILGLCQISDDEWEILRRQFGERSRKPGPGRPPTPTRVCVQALFLKLCSYVPARKHTLMLGVCYDTLRERVEEWIRDGVFVRLWGSSVQTYDDLVGLKLDELIVDGCIVTARNGGEKTGPSPVDRGKKACKRSVLSDGAGVPLGIVSAGANINDQSVLAETIESSIVKLPVGAALHADRGYRGAPAANAAAERGVRLVVPEKDEASSHRAKRHAIENLNQRHNRFFALKHRAERRADYYDALLMLAAAIITFRLCSWALARPRQHTRYSRLRGPPRE